MKPLAFSGKVSSGKTTIAEALKKRDGYQILSIGLSIKQVCMYLIEGRKDHLETIVRFLTDDEEKREEVRRFYETLYADQFADAHFIKGEDGLYVKNDAYRSFTQQVAKGTRERFGEDIWVRLVANQMRERNGAGERVVCDDVRMPSEKALFEEQGIAFVRLNVSPDEQLRRAEALYGEVDPSRFLDETETALDDASFDLVIDTTGQSIEETVTEVEQFLRR